MKKWIILLLIVLSFTPLARAMDGCNQHLSRDEFRAKQKAFIMDRAELTKEEAAKFFPIYFELQDKKKELSDKVWELLRKGKSSDLTDAQYNDILVRVYDSRIASDKLEKAYYERFKKILSSKQLFMVQKAEMRFHRELLKGVNRKGNEGSREKK